MQAGFQLALELSNVFPIREAVQVTFDTVISFARNLQKSGTDIIVEEDLALIFGRGRIDAAIKERFKKDVLKTHTFVPLHKDCEIVLDTRLGPSVSRAFQSKDSGYLSTVIQLSMLGWMQSRENLVLALSESMAKRYQMKLPGATNGFDMERLTGSIAAFSSETSAFPWNRYVDAVEQRLKECLQYPGIGSEVVRYLHDELLAIAPSTLLAAMDYLYLVQSLPENRKMTISNQKGLITIIIWAHYLLNITVVVKGVQGRDIHFGEGSASVIIKWAHSETFLTDPEICLLDSDMQIVLKTEPDEFRLYHILEACERHPLQNIGTTTLQRRFNTRKTVPKDSPLYSDAAQLVVAKAVLASRKLSRAPTLMREGKPLNQFNMDRWRITATTRIIFDDIDIDEEAVNSYIEKADDDCELPFKAFPRALLNLEKVWQSDGDYESMSDFIDDLMGLVLVMAHISGIEHAADLPLLLDYKSIGVARFSKLARPGNPEPFGESELLFTVGTMLVGKKFVQEEKAHEEEDPLFLFSDFGWSIFLAAVGDNDPAMVQPELLHIKRGIPTSLSTGERKFRMRDSLEGLCSDAPQPKVMNPDESSIPRCTLNVQSRVEYYASGKNDFRLAIKFSGVATTNVLNQSNHPKPDENFNMYLSYRGLHQALWKTTLAPPCEHPHDEKNRLTFGVDIAAIHGLDCPHNMAERICICLVKDSSRARWLAVYGTLGEHCDRQVMLRGERCCETCAVDAAAKVPGKWFVII